MPTYHIVVAKYKEDVSWLFHMDLPHLYVYDKSGDDFSPFIQLENKGREGATFLAHIVKYYETLPDYLILVQGDPYPHMYSEITPSNFQDYLIRLLETKPKKSQPLFCNYWNENLHLYDGLMIDKYHRLLFEGEPQDTIIYASGNQYIIPRSDIQRRPKLFYQKLYKMALKGDHYTLDEAHFTQKEFDPTEILGWSLERVFDTILSDTPTNPKFIT